MRTDFLKTLLRKDLSTPAITQQKQIFYRVFIYGFIIQMAARAAAVESVDQSMWAKQIQYFLAHDPRLFDFYAAYGHPGTTLVELGSLFHILFGFSYSTALAIGMSVLIAVVTAACSVLCFLLYRQSLWWLAAAFVLLLNRMYINATPPTAVVMPFTVLIVLATWWLWQEQGRTSRWPYFLWGAIMGLAAATRLDASLLVGTPMFLLLWYRHGRRVVLPLLAGAGISFFIADPFLWFMPIQHITDLVHKFTMHYAHYYSPAKMEPSEFINAMWMSTVSFGWAFVLLFYRRRRRIIPLPILIVFSSISVLAVMVVLSSIYQAARYLFPLIIIWEVFLPLYVLETLAPTNSIEPSKVSNRSTAISSSVIALVVVTQLIAYLFIFI